MIFEEKRKKDLRFYIGLDEFKEPEFKGYGLENSKKESNVVCEKESDNSKENSDKSLVKEQESQVKSSLVKGCGSNTSKNDDEDSEIWMNQNEYNLIKKKYPLSQEMISKMLSKRLEVDHESTQAYELLKFIRSQVQK
ncbi:hypothetical protein Tco_1098640 [Tanacetum coccineum]